MADTPPSPSLPPPSLNDVNDVADTAPRLSLEINIVPKEFKIDRLKTPSTPSTRRPSLQSRTSMNGPLYMQTSNNKVFIRRVKRKGDGTVKSLTRWLLDNQIGRCTAQGFSSSYVFPISHPSATHELRGLVSNKQKSVLLSHLIQLANQ